MTTIRQINYQNTRIICTYKTIRMTDTIKIRTTPTTRTTIQLINRHNPNIIIIFATKLKN